MILEKNPNLNLIIEKFTILSETCIFEPEKGGGPGGPKLTQNTVCLYEQTSENRKMIGYKLRKWPHLLRF